MTVMPEALRQANEQLVALTIQFVDGDLARREFRQARRQLICQTLGLEVPEVPEAHDHLALPGEDDTMPGAVPASPSQASPESGPVAAPLPASTEADDSEAADAISDAPAVEAVDTVKVKETTFQVTLLLLLLAFVGLGGLLWFVLR